MQLRKQFPIRALRAFFTEEVACGKGVGREEEVGCVGGSCCSSVPQSLFSLFCAWLPVFSHRCSLKQQAASSKEGSGWRGVGWKKPLPTFASGPVAGSRKDACLFLHRDPVFVYYRSGSEEVVLWCACAPCCRIAAGLPFSFPLWQLSPPAALECAQEFLLYLDIL